MNLINWNPKTKENMAFKNDQYQNVRILDIPSYGKVPPQNRVAEEAILGACMIERSAFDTAAEIIKPECFYSEAHKKIFSAMVFLNGNGQPIDEITVVQAIRMQDELDLVGGPYYITKLTNGVVSGANVETHARMVMEAHIRREMIRMSGETICEAYQDSCDFYELMENHEKALAQIMTGSIQTTFTGIRQIGNEVVNRIYHMQAHPSELTGVDTGYSILNAITNGWQTTDFIILAGRPSVGKTALALNLLRSAANKTGVGMFSLEMSKEQLMGRLLAAESEIYLDKINNGKMTLDEANQVAVANTRLSELRIFIDDTGGIDIYELGSKARRMVAKHGVSLIIIDYLQLMSGEGNKTQNREQEVSSISRKVKALAKELKISIIGLSQMSRDIEKRKGEPQLSDLRETGALEQDADMVLFCYRDDYQADPNAEANNTGYVKIAKHRNGHLDKIAFRTDMRVQGWFDSIGWARYESRLRGKNPF
jgi:replicative DNA helicase